MVEEELLLLLLYCEYWSTGAGEGELRLIMGMPPIWTPARASMAAFWDGV